jgi:hypothetical protein
MSNCILQYWTILSSINKFLLAKDTSFLQAYKFYHRSHFPENISKTDPLFLSKKNSRWHVSS